MIKNIRPLAGFASNNVRENVLSKFRVEQSSSNEYLISLCKQKLFNEAIKAFEFLQKEKGFCLNLGTYAYLISACSHLRSLEHGRKIHDHLVQSNYRPDLTLQNHILNMYGKCGSLKDAQKLFDAMPERNVVSWTSVIAGYAQNGQGGNALELYSQMLQSGVMPDQFTFGSIIKACSMLGDIGLGRQLHAHVRKSEYGAHIIAQNALISMYTKSNLIIDALDVFSRMLTRDLISWGSMIAGFSQMGYELEALCYFKEMLHQGVYLLNEFIFGSVFSACSSLLQPEFGRQLHGMSVKYGIGRDVFAGCSLCDMYAKCGFLSSARDVFHQIGRPDLVAWNAMIAGFAYGDDAKEAIAFFSQMRHQGLIPDEITVRSLLCAFTSPSKLYEGTQVHAYISKMGLDLDVPVCNTLLTMYAKCSELRDAIFFFEEMSYKADLVSWNAIITACMHHNQVEEVFRLLKLMCISQHRPDYISLTNVLGACTDIVSIEIGSQVHCFALKIGLLVDISITNGLIDLYAKCGYLETARKIFDSMINPDVVSWSSLVLGYAQFGHGEEALKLFETMRRLDVKPNHVTFVGVLTACSHVGLVEEGRQLYRNMEKEFGIVPSREHFSCMVDLLGRAGCLNEAEGFIHHMAFDPDIVVWKTLLAACKTHGNIDVGKRAAENILKIDPSNSAAHVLLCNLYASKGNWEEFSRLRSLMKQRGVRKVPGQSWIEVKNRTHVFFVADTLHPEINKINAMQGELLLQMLDAGYVPSQK